ncbi:RNA-binding protein [Gudongella sp. DL1XJH-153]|uniref:YlmH family RNA-binding protein n=1 Tax=Gudongella sp. DL1XJH-153 TaxID=3409804 RepID=UPI003BB7C54A
MLDKGMYLNHINDNEIVFKMRRLLDLIESSLKSHMVIESDFMDPYEQKLSESILNRFQELSYIFHGGLEETERKCIIIHPEYIYSEDLESPVSYLKIEGHLDGLNHKDYLGAIMGIGLTREKIGDILLYENYTVVIVKKEIKDYILLNFEKAGNKNISISEIQGENLVYPKPDFIELKKFVASLRLDVYLSAAYNISRSESMGLIKSGDTKVNWEKIKKSDTVLEIGDVVSVRGKGRTIFYGLGGTSKKGRLNLTIRKLV